MSKMSSNKPSVRSAKLGQLVGGHRVLGTTKDGVSILKPKPATNFTSKELRDAITQVRSAK